MKQTDERYQQYIKVLKEELVAAMGCTLSFERRI